MSVSTEPSVAAPVVLPHAYPLDEFYANAGLALPRIETIAGPAMPEPYRALLVHEGDMTPALERFYGSPIHLEVLRSEERHSFYYREVVLIADAAGERAEFGAIKISLDRFPPAARKEILAERLPLGTILAKHRIRHFSRPKAFLKIAADDFIERALGISGKRTLFGRRNTLSNPGLEPLAEIVEILPPAN